MQLEEENQQPSQKAHAPGAGAVAVTGGVHHSNIFTRVFVGYSRRVAVSIFILLALIAACFVPGVMSMRSQARDLTKMRGLVAEIADRTTQSSASGKPETPAERFDRALSEVAFKYNLTPEQLRSGIDGFVTKVQANPQSSFYDQALADFARKQFASAAGKAEQAAQQTGQERETAQAKTRELTAREIREWTLAGDAHSAAFALDAAVAAYQHAVALIDKTAVPLAWADMNEKLALVYLHKAAYNEARPLLEEIVRIREKELGSENPAFATALSNLAQLLKATNRLAEAEPLMRRVINIFEKSLGKDHPVVAIAISNLATLLQATNRFADAEPLMRRALAIDEKSYGPEHPKVAIYLNNLAHLLQDTNRLAEAEPMMRRHLEIFLLFTHRTGYPHPHLNDAIENYTSLLLELGWKQDKIVEHIKQLREEVKKPGFKLADVTF